MEQRSNLATCWSKRNSKLESFLKRSLPPHVYNDIRYYIGCIVKSAKEALAYKYVIVTSQSVLFADSSCRCIQEAVKFPDILNINVECDYPYFLKGPEANSCQHIRLSLKQANKFPLKDVEEDVPFKALSHRRQLSRELEEHSVLKADIDSKTTGDHSVFFSESFRNTEERTYQASRVPTYELMIPEHEETCKLKKNFYGPENLRCIKFKHQSRGINWNTPGSSSSSPEPESLSSLLSRVENAKPHVPRSRSSLSQHTFGYLNSPNIQPDIITQRSQSSLETRRNYKKKPSGNDITMTGPTEMHFFPKSDIHLYVLKGNSELLNQLQACWFTGLIIATLELEGIKINTKMSFCDTGQEFLQLKAIYQHFKRVLTDSLSSLDLSFQYLQEFRVGLQQNPDMKRLFWKDQMLYNLMIQKLHLFLLRPTTSVSCAYTQAELISTRQFELELAALLLDILLITLQDSDSIADKMKMLQLNGGMLLRGLICLLVSAPTIPSGYNTMCARMLEDFHEFSSCAWCNLPEAEVIKLMAYIINLSTAILYELFLTARNLVSRNAALKFPILLEGVTVECHLKRCFTQILGILFSQQPQKLKPKEAVLVYQHFFVLQHLMENNKKVQEYIQQHFKEEFRYYMHWSRISHKLSNDYPIKRLLPPLVDKVHQLATDHQFSRASVVKHR